MTHTYRYSTAARLYPLLFLIAVMVVIIAVLIILNIRAELNPDYMARKIERRLQACSDNLSEKPPLFSTSEIAILVITVLCMLWVILTYENEIIMLLIAVLGMLIIALHMWLRWKKY